jgi:hypothetical protein
MVRTAGLAGLVALTAAGRTGAAEAVGAVDAEDRWVEAGLRAAPVPLDLEGRQRELVGLGSYLVNVVATCGGCHTHPEYASGGDPFRGEPARIDPAAYLAGGTDFGRAVSSSIRPDGAGLPAGLGYEGFVRAMRHGEARGEPGKVLQVMPWPAFNALDERDLRAMYEYLAAIAR